MKNLTKAEEMALAVHTNLNRVLMDEDERGPEVDKIDIGENGSDCTDFFTAELLALRLQFQELTNTDNDNCDLFDFIAILNKLAVQYVSKISQEDK